MVEAFTIFRKENIYTKNLVREPEAKIPLGERN
jgi:hypothetical protein